MPRTLREDPWAGAADVRPSTVGPLRSQVAAASCVVLTLAVLAIATLVGAALRGRNEARTQLVELEELTAELLAFRIIQEALSSAMRHAPGAEVRVEIDHRPSAVTIRGADTAPPRPAQFSPGVGQGLLVIRKRAAMLCGRLASGATSDGGYEVIAMLPTQLPAVPADLVEDNP
ncbi:hypothetical protein OG609_36200 [Streptomyces sp. NBC_01224]|uniref:ATP-binding protein n=1 Tax=Streptomyces sp. NBC_01224 TaxID=2903783 RepID=UPI002E0F9C44|nr:hypothetical protein OG609_36200 [Streptomyces sp. NBC_01224]